jgi:hypothetical protein
MTGRRRAGGELPGSRLGLKSNHIGLPLGAFMGVLSTWFIPDRWTNLQVAALVAAEIAVVWAGYWWVARRRRQR